MKKTSLLHKAVFSAVLILLPISFTFAHTYNTNKRDLSNYIMEDISVITAMRRMEVYGFIEGAKKRAIDFSSDGYIKDRLAEINNMWEMPGSALNDHLIKNKLSLDANISVIHVISLGGKVAASTDRKAVGTDVRGKEFFIQGKKSPVVTESFFTAAEDSFLVASAPIRGEDGKKLIGVIANFIPLQKLTYVMAGEFKDSLNLTRRIEKKRATLESYIVNKDGFMITEPRLIKEAVLKQRVSTLPVDECRKSNKTVAGFYPNYRGVEVAGASGCIPPMKWAVVTEIDKDEALEHLNALLRNAVLTAAVVGGLVGALLIVFGRAVVKPLRAMERAAREIAGGNFRIKIPVATTDEIGGLGMAFNTMARDIQERTEALKRSTERFKALVETTSDWVWEVDANGVYTYVSPKVRGVLGYEPEEILGKTPFDLMPPDEAKRVSGIFKTISDGKRPFALLENTNVHKSGRLVVLETSGSPILDGDGRLLGYRGMDRDITERKKADEAQARLTAILDATPDLVATADPQGRVLFMNSGGRKMIGIGEDEDIGNMMIPDAHPEWAVRVILDEALPAAARDGAWSGETVFLSREGRLIPASQVIIAHKGDNKDVLYYSTVARDISAHKKADEALRRSEAGLSEAQRIAHLGNWEWDIVKNTLEWSEEVYRIFGLAPREFGGTYGAFLSFIHPDDREYVKKSVNEALYEGKRYGIDHRIILPDGTEKTVHEEGEVKFDIFRRPMRMIGTVHDITERVNAIKALSKSEAKYRALFEESKDAIYIATPEGRLIDINPAGVDLFGYSSKEEMLALDIAKDLYYNPQDKERFKKAIDKEGFVRDFELALKKKDGSHIIALKTASAVRNDKGLVTAYRGIIRDVTEHKRLEAELIHAEKMEAIGKFTGSISHDFKNILTVIIANANIIRKKLPDDDALAVNAEHLLQSSRRGVNLIQGLLAFSRKEPPALTPAGINSIVKGLDDIVSSLLLERKDIKVRITYAEDDPVVMVNHAQMEQAVTNLCTNAIDAMPEGGVLNITASSGEPLRPILKEGCYAGADKCASISVTDTGAGMDRDTLDKVFEPFFTTKSAGKGTGLGLAIVSSIVRQHNGYITVSSSPGKGTTFRINLPIAG